MHQCKKAARPRSPLFPCPTRLLSLALADTLSAMLASVLVCALIVAVASQAATGTLNFLALGLLMVLSVASRRVRSC